MGIWGTGMKHFVWTEGETVAQFHSTGSWSIQCLDPDDDARNRKKESGSGTHHLHAVQFPLQFG